MSSPRGPDWLVWDAEPTSQQYAQHVEYRLRSDHTGASTVVRVDITVEPDSFYPDFLIKRAGKSVIAVFQTTSWSITEYPWINRFRNATMRGRSGMRRASS